MNHSRDRPINISRYYRCKKSGKINFIKKNEATYKMSIPEAKLIEYAFENGYIKEEPEND